MKEIIISLSIDLHNEYILYRNNEESIKIYCQNSYKINNCDDKTIKNVFAVYNYCNQLNNCISGSSMLSTIFGVLKLYINRFFSFSFIYLHLVKSIIVLIIFKYTYLFITKIILN